MKRTGQASMTTKSADAMSTARRRVPVDEPISQVAQNPAITPRPIAATRPNRPGARRPSMAGSSVWIH